MTAKLRLAISILTGMVIYLIPAVLWFYDDMSGAMLMFFYTIESLVTTAFAVVTVLILSPEKEEPKQGNYNRKSDLLKNFLILSSGFGAGAIMFVSVFVFLFLKESFDLGEVGFALGIILGFQIFEFLADLFLLRPLTLKKAEFFLSDSLGGVAFVIFAVFIGFFLAMFSKEWFVMPFLILHAIIVIWSPIQYFGKAAATA